MEDRETSRRNLLGVAGGVALAAAAQAETKLAAPANEILRAQSNRAEVSPKWVRVVFGGQVVANSRRALLVWDRGRTPAYYFPEKDVRMEFLKPTEHRAHSDTKGDAAYYTVQVGDKKAENAAWTYPKPETADPALGPAADLRGYVSFQWGLMDGWYEEGEEVFVHPRDPYHRIDVLNSSRHVRVVLGGVAVAESRHPVLLFETGFVARYYLPKEDVRLGLLRPSDTITRCPYKGEARYYSVAAGDRLYKDVIWYYRYPTTEATKIANHLCFYNEQVDAIFVDGEEAPKPQRTRG